MARLRPRGLGCALALYTWAFRGETLVPTLAAQTVLRVRKGKAAHAAHVLIWPTAAPLVRNSPRGWTPRSLTTIRLSEGEPLRGAVVGPGSSRNPGPIPKRWLVPGCRLRPSILCRPACRQCRRARWLDLREPQGPGEPSVPTLEASSAQVSGRRPYKTRAAKRPSAPNAEDCLSSEGGRRRLCAATSARRRLCAATSAHRRLRAATSVPAFSVPGIPR
jgi:hypothetical protein